MTKCSHCDQPVHPLQETCGSCGERLRDRREDRGARSGELGEDERGMTARPGEGDSSSSRNSRSWRRMNTG